jgi:hypothetical protein
MISYFQEVVGTEQDEYKLFHDVKVLNGFH